VSSEFDAFAERKAREAAEARIGALVTEEDRSAGLAGMRLGNAWTRAHYDGDVLLLPAPDARPAISLVFVQSLDGNTGAEHPADLGGGSIDLHLIYEGLSRVAADAVLAGGATANGRAFFSVWHPAVVALRSSLGLPRHPTQIVISGDGNLDVDGTLLFNVPSVPVFIIAGPRCQERCRGAVRHRPWITLIPLRDRDLDASLRELRRRGLDRISVVGGRSTASALIDAGLVQDMFLTTTSSPGGDPGTPFYVGRHTPSFRPIVRKRSTPDPHEGAIRVEHVALRVPA
jgi:riboflavin biosynthesis pyrimidine reductase